VTPHGGRSLAAAGSSRQARLHVCHELRPRLPMRRLRASRPTGKKECEGAGDQERVGKTAVPQNRVIRNTEPVTDAIEIGGVRAGDAQQKSRSCESARTDEGIQTERDGRVGYDRCHCY